MLRTMIFHVKKGRFWAISWLKTVFISSEEKAISSEEKRISSEEKHISSEEKPINVQL